MSVILVNCFEVPAGRESEFFSLWEQVNNYMRSKPGYLQHKLHRSLAPDAPIALSMSPSGPRPRISRLPTTPDFMRWSVNPYGPTSAPRLRSMK
jgi:hypothetical protein